MNKDDTIAAYYFERGLYIKISDHLQEVRSAVAVDRENVAKLMVERGYATGHGDTVEDLFKELEWQVAEREREACRLIVLDNSDAEGICCTDDVLEAFRQRGEK
jgi:hypothetical protein